MSDVESDVVLSFDLFTQNNGTGLLTSMIDGTHDVLPHPLNAVHASAGYRSVLELGDCREYDAGLFTSVTDRSALKRKESQDGGEHIPAIDFQFDVGSRTPTCPVDHQMSRIIRTNTTRADERHMLKLQFEQDESACQACSPAGNCIGQDSRCRSAHRLKVQHLLNAHNQKIDSTKRYRSNTFCRQQAPP